MNIEELAFKDRTELAHLNDIDLLNIIEFLQNDRKQWINQFSKTHNESIEIQKENQELKQKYVDAVADYETTMAEKKELKKQVETYEIEGYKQNEELNKMSFDIRKYNTQQKEFIKYLSDMLDDEKDIFSVVRVKDILEKYKRIIGD